MTYIAGGDNDCISVVSFNKETLKKRPANWTNERIFRLGFLLGLGWDAKRIASDPLIDSNPNNIHRQVARFGGHFRDAAMGVTLRQASADFYDAEAGKRGLTREKLIQVLLEEIASDKSLFDNIMDDGDRF